jgi:outer membrane receptor protein involved in Fe transport
MPSSLAMLFLVLRLTDQTPRIAEFVDVTTDTGARLTSPAAVTRLEYRDLATAPAATLDDTLRSVPGFSLFRRSSSRVANPTTQGVTLRGLAASGSSRAVVLADDIPLNDPFGGWVYWNRIPAAAIGQVDVVRGPAGDLFGPDAVGGSVLIDTHWAPGFRMLADGGTDATARVSVMAGAELPADVHVAGAAEQFTTDGFVIVAPEARGPIDTPAASKHWSAHGTVMSPGGHRTSGQVRGSYFSERRRNGTPFQTNSTVIRQVSGVVRDSSGVGGRAYFVSQDYDQTFSAVLAGRAAERPTSRQHVDARTFGGAVEWHRALPAGGMMLAGSGRRIETTLVDEPIPAPSGPTVTDANQWTAGASAVLTLNPTPRITLAGGLRVEAWRTNQDADATSAGVVLVMPRVSAVFAATDRLSFRAAVQNADRNPTLNELYRPFRVGNVLTLANPALVPETVTGFEGSATWTGVRRVTLRGLAFWTEVDDAVVNVTLSAPGTPTILRQRQNASHIRARGAEGEIEWRAPRGLTFTASGALTDSKFTEADLDGLWVPQVARAQMALGVRGTWTRFTAGGEWRYIGRQFDDDRNQFPLNRASMLDGRVGWLPVQGVELFAALENAFDEEMDVGRTPIRTIGLPRTLRAGIRITR